MKKNYHHSTSVQYKKSPINLFSLYRMKKKLNKRKENIDYHGPIYYLL
jgi:hypothetical protein